MHVVRYRTPRAFLEAAEPFLLRDEAAHNLLLGVPARLIAREDAGGAPSDVYLAAAVDRGEVVATAMMTPPYQLVLSHSERPDAIAALAEDAGTLGPAPPGVLASDTVAPPFLEAWRRITGASARRVVHERIHRLETARPVPIVPGAMRPAAVAERRLLLEWLRAFAAEAFHENSRPPGDAETVLEMRLTTPGEGLMVWEDAGPRCLAGYGGRTRHGVRVGPVYTPPVHRNRGYGTACVAALSRMLLTDGRAFCMLYTDLSNPASNRIYARIGYEPVCDVAEYRFERAGGQSPVTSVP